MKLVWSGGVVVLFVYVLLAFAEQATPDLFEDRTARSGIDFVLRNGATGQKHLIETMTGGVAVLDYDRDGLPDIYFVNGADSHTLQKSEPRDCNRLYRNKGNWQFEDVTSKAGVCGTGFGMGVSAADYDNDGSADLLVITVEGNQLFHNQGDGTFKDVTTTASLKGDGWGIAAAWLDYDNDGLLDLFEVRYVKWDATKEQWCGDSHRKIRTYCHPKFYEPTSNRLYRNNGDGTFTDVSQRSGIASHLGKGMGLASADYDQDGRMDVFVANDTMANFLFHNEGAGRFREVGSEAGVALNDDGKALSSMGVDFRDIDNDGKEDIFVTALANETFPFFRNVNGRLFLDRTYPSGIGALTTSFSGWGAGIVDLDNDGWKDIFTANGDVQENTEQYSSGKSRQRNLVLWNRAGKWSASEISKPGQHRGAAFADFDRDGSVDVVVTRLNDTPLLLRNVSPAANNWLDVQLVGAQSNRQGLGVRITLIAGKARQVNHANRRGSITKIADDTRRS